MRPRASTRRSFEEFARVICRKPALLSRLVAMARLRQLDRFHPSLAAPQGHGPARTLAPLVQHLD